MTKLKNNEELIIWVNFLEINVIITVINEKEKVVLNSDFMLHYDKLIVQVLLVLCKVYENKVVLKRKIEIKVNEV